MALQPKFIASGKPMAAFTMVVRFLIGPGVIAATSLAIGLRGVLLQIVIVQVHQLKLKGLSKKKKKKKTKIESAHSLISILIN